MTRRTRQVKKMTDQVTKKRKLSKVEEKSSKKSRIVPSTKGIVPSTKPIVPSTKAIVPSTKVIVPSTKVIVASTNEESIAEKYGLKSLSKSKFPPPQVTALKEWIGSKSSGKFYGIHQVVCIEGPSASGKSTLARLILQENDYNFDILDGTSKDATLGNIFEMAIHSKGVVPVIDDDGKKILYPKRALILEDIGSWKSFAFGKFADLLFSHKTKNNKDDDSVEYKLPAAYPVPITIPIICTYTPGEKTNKGFKRFLNQCQRIILRGFSDVDFKSILRPIFTDLKISVDDERLNKFILQNERNLSKMFNLINFELSGLSLGSRKKIKIIDNGVYSAAKMLLKEGKNCPMDKSLSLFKKNKNVNNLIYANYLGGMHMNGNINEVSNFYDSCTKMDARKMRNTRYQKKLSLITMMDAIDGWNKTDMKILPAPYHRYGKHKNEAFIEDFIKVVHHKWILNVPVNEQENLLKFVHRYKKYPLSEARYKMLDEYFCPKISDDE